MSSAVPVTSKRRCFARFGPLWRFVAKENSVCMSNDGKVHMAAAIAARVGLNAVMSRDRPGFLIEALAYAQFNDAVRMFQDGYASPADIDTAMMLGFFFKQKTAYEIER